MIITVNNDKYLVNHTKNFTNTEIDVEHYKRITFSDIVIQQNNMLFFCNKIEDAIFEEIHEEIKNEEDIQQVNSGQDSGNNEA